MQPTKNTHRAVFIRKNLLWAVNFKFLVGHSMKKLTLTTTVRSECRLSYRTSLHKSMCLAPQTLWSVSLPPKLTLVNLIQTPKKKNIQKKNTTTLISGLVTNHLFLFVFSRFWSDSDEFGVTLINPVHTSWLLLVPAFLSPKWAKSDSQRLGLRVILYFIKSLVFWRTWHLSKQMPKKMKQNKADEEQLGHGFGIFT